jgi:predicted aspartyl protease
MSATKTRRPATHGLRQVASATLLLATLSAAHAQCKYKRLGAIPTEWAGPRLVVDGSVNGTPTKMVVDTGATDTSVSSALAERLNLTLSHAYGEAAGIGGRSALSLARLSELSIGPFKWHRTQVAVVWNAAKGLSDVLVGGNVLLQNDVELDGKQILLFSPSGCADAALGYWADDVPWVPTEAVTSEDLRTVVTVLINGQPVRALIDTGAPHTILDTAVARRLGFDPDDARARVGETGGIGAHTTVLSTATFDTIAIGPEIVRHARLYVTDLWRGVKDDYHQTSTARYVDEQPQMLLGADFVRSHHLLFASSQRRLYFSYLGGEVFTAPSASSLAAAPASAASAPPASAGKSGAGG